VRDDADYTAIVTWGASFGKNGPIYCLEAKRGHWSLRDTVRELFLTHEKWKQSRTIIETVAYQQALADEVFAEQQSRRTNICPVEVKPDRDKERRAHSVTALCQAGRVHLDLSDPGQQRFLDEMILFPTGDHDDLVDAGVMGLMDIRDWGGRASKHDGPIIVRSTRGVEKV